MYYIEPALYIYYSLYLRLTTRIPGSCLYTVVTPVQSLTFNFLSIREPRPKFVMSHCTFSDGVNFEFVPPLPHQVLSATNLVSHAYDRHSKHPIESLSKRPGGLHEAARTLKCEAAQHRVGPFWYLVSNSHSRIYSTAPWRGEERRIGCNSCGSPSNPSHSHNAKFLPTGPFYFQVRTEHRNGRLVVSHRRPRRVYTACSLNHARVHSWLAAHAFSYATPAPEACTTFASRSCVWFRT